MKPEILEKFKKALINDEKLDEIINSEEFYFQKAVDKYNEFMDLPKIGKEKTKEILARTNLHKGSIPFSHMALIEDYKDDLNTHDLLLKMAELIAYIDSKAANKNKFNKYEDKRTIARSGVRQNDWLVNLLNYKETKKIDDLPGAIENAIRYIINPDKVLNVLSERHRKLMDMFIFQNSDTILNFDEIAIHELDKLDIKVKNEKNKPYIYERLLYGEGIKKIWNYNQTIWKISNGNIQSFTEEERKSYLEEKIVVIHNDAGKSQENSFNKTMKVRDLFYLCYGSKEIKLIGKITSESSPLGDYGYKRSYEIIKESINKEDYKGIDKNWAPNHNSTCVYVREDHLTIFEEEILQPYFEISLDELLSSEPIDPPVIQPVTPTLIPPVIIEPPEKVFDDLNYIVYGPPGTGKTYNTINYAVAMIENKEVETVQVEEYKIVKERYEKLKAEKQVAFTTFHQSFGYEEFIEGIKPRLNSDCSDEISYYISEGVFKEFCSVAKENKNKNYVFIIDEINRGNISKIFGELITLIEKSKRIGREEETKTKLPYSKEEFGVPENVFILGTMNTADRSIALLDTALRRRFKFIEMMPDTGIFKKLNDNQELIVDEGINIKDMLNMINDRIEILYDREHTIGQAYFIDLIEDSRIDNLSDIFLHKVIPLLQEYFYDDYEKLRMILGDNQTENPDLQFINVGDIPKNIFGRNLDSELLEDKKVYSINTAALTNPEAYIKIYDMNIGSIKNE